MLTKWKLLCLVVLLVNVVWIISFIAKEDQIPNFVSKTVYANRCNTTLPQNKGRVPRPPTLVIYVFAEVGDELKNYNLNYFLEYGLCEDCSNVDYAIVINGNSTIEIPNHKNIFIYRRENACGDFGAWGYLFEHMDPEKLKKYKRFMFINDTVRGPFISPTYTDMLPPDFHFTDLFNQLMTNETRMVGSYINCGGFSRGQVVEGHAHVQTMSFMLDEVSLKLSLPLFRCFRDHEATIAEGEIGLSKMLVANNVNLGSLLYAYRGVDFRCNDQMRINCNDGRNPFVDGWYFGFSANPVEVVFYKNTQTSGRKNNMTDLYSEWFTST